MADQHKNPPLPHADDKATFTGDYKDNTEKLTEAERYPNGPKAPDPNPFTLGPLSTGER